MLMTVLIIGAIGLAIATSLLLLGTGSLRTALTLQQSSHVKAHADSCSEEALLNISTNATYAGSGSASFTDGSCTYTVTHGTQSEIIDAVGIEGTLIRKVRVTLDTNGFSWKEIP